MTPSQLMLLACALSFIIAFGGALLGLYIGGFFDRSKIAIAERPTNWLVLILSGVCGYFFGRAVVSASWPLAILWGVLSFLVSIAWGYVSCPIMASRGGLAGRARRVYGSVFGNRFSDGPFAHAE